MALLVAATSGAAEQTAAPAQPAALAQPTKSLDLRPPKITHLYTPAQIENMLASTRKSDIEEVEVHGARERAPSATPTVWPGLFAPVWAVLNQTQAWRIFAPLPPDQTRGLQSARFDATSGYLEPAARPPM